LRCPLFHCDRHGVFLRASRCDKNRALPILTGD
jgi:hypothetical protein